jgi:hypothetical protein
LIGAKGALMSLRAIPAYQSPTFCQIFIWFSIPSRPIKFCLNIFDISRLIFYFWWTESKITFEKISKGKK